MNFLSWLSLSAGHVSELLSDKISVYEVLIKLHIKRVNTSDLPFFITSNYPVFHKEVPAKHSKQTMQIYTTDDLSCLLC